jgi:hypothetical protein
MWLCGLLSHVLLSLAMWSGVVVYGWLAMWLAVYMSMVVWLAGSLALLETKAILAGKFQRIFGLKIAKNSFKIAATFAGILADFMLIFAPQKPKPKNPKSASKNETQNLKSKVKT